MNQRSPSFDAFSELQPKRKWSPWLVAAGVFPAAFLLLFLRRPETLTRPEFWADDGLFYKLGLQIGVRSLFTSYAGTLVIVQRLVVIVETSVVPTLAPMVGNFAAVFVTALVAGFLASPRMSDFVPNPRWRVVLALAFVLLPATGWLFWTLATVQWFTGTYLVAMLVATPPVSTRGRVGDALGLLLAGLTGPLSILLLPFYLIRGVFAPEWRWHAIWIGIAAAIQFTTLTVSDRFAPAGLDPAALPEVLALRAVILPLAGVAAFLPTGPIAIVLLILLLAGIRHLPPMLTVGGLLIAAGVAVAGLLVSQSPTATLLDPDVTPQYFYVAGFIFGGLVIAALARGHLAAIPIAIVLAVGIVGDARVPAVPDVGWAQLAACIGGPEPCVVPVAPGPHWWVSWP